MAENESLSKKLQSRKFLIWLVWMIICLAFCILNFVKDGYVDLTKEVIQDFFFITLTYLGANVATKSLSTLGHKNESEEKEEQTE